MNHLSKYVGLLFVLPMSCFPTEILVSTQAEFDAVRYAVLQAGDAIWLERGRQFTGMLSPTGRGTEAEPIRIGAYGEGVLLRYMPWG